jgi:hypothetical protein
MKKTYFAYMGIALSILILLMACGGCGGDNESESSDYDQSQESNQYQANMTSSNQFSGEQDVRTYLCTHRFYSNDGTSMSFRSNGNSLFMNGTQLTSTIEVRVTSASSALIRTHGPYGETTLTLSISSGRGIVQDHQSGDSYISQ